MGLERTQKVKKTEEVNPPTEEQLFMLKGLKWKGDTPKTRELADRLISRLKRTRGGGACFVSNKSTKAP